MGDNKFYKEAFVSYINDSGDMVDGYFLDVELYDNYISFKTKQGTALSLPWNRILKVKAKND